MIDILASLMVYGLTGAVYCNIIQPLLVVRVQMRQMIREEITDVILRRRKF